MGTPRAWGVPAGHYWKVVEDPTRTGEDPGFFYGGCFRWSDIQPPIGAETRRIPCPWPSGTVFENIRTGERVVIRRGRVIMLGGRREKDRSSVVRLRAEPA